MKCVLFASGKGGVGKTTIVANVAARIAQRGQRVACLDADVYAPALHQILTPIDRRIEEDAEHERLIPVETSLYGIRLFSIAFVFDESIGVPQIVLAYFVGGLMLACGIALLPRSRGHAA